MSAVAAARRLAGGVWARVPTVTMPQKLKGGRIERWVDYWINLSRDYKDTFITIGGQIRDRPGKATVYFTAIAAAFHLNNTNPNDRDLRTTLQEHLNNSAIMSARLRSPKSDATLNHFIDCYNHDTLRRLNLILFSLAWEDNYNSECSVYKASVSHLKPRYLTFIQDRVLDIGFLGKWWYIEHVMSTLDVNEEEWDDQGNRNPAFVLTRGPALGML